MEDERIECGWFSMKQLRAMIENGGIQDAKTIIGWSVWKMRRKKSGTHSVQRVDKGE